MREGPEWRGREGRLEVRRRGEGEAGIERGGLRGVYQLWFPDLEDSAGAFVLALPASAQ